MEFCHGDEGIRNIFYVFQILFNNFFTKIFNTILEYFLIVFCITKKINIFRKISIFISTFTNKLHHILNLLKLIVS